MCCPGCGLAVHAVCCPGCGLAVHAVCCPGCGLAVHAVCCPGCGLAVQAVCSKRLCAVLVVCYAGRCAHYIAESSTQIFVMRYRGSLSIRLSRKQISSSSSPIAGLLTPLLQLTVDVVFFVTLICFGESSRLDLRQLYRDRKVRNNPVRFCELTV